MRPVFARITRRISTSRASAFERKVIETVCPRIHHYLFPNIPTPATSAPKEYTGVLPPLEADNIVDHFRVLADRQTHKYRELLQDACRFDLERAKNVLEFIDKKELWRFETGWTRYPFNLTSDGADSIGPIAAPPDSVLFFDIELVVRDGNLPTLAIALGPNAWYGWCSERLINCTDVPEVPTRKDLIPIGDVGAEKVVIGHNVGFDRARCAEVYEMKSSRIRFMDTMSLSIPMYGMADHQQALYEMYDVEEMENNVSAIIRKRQNVFRE
ncbi:unnamed protein product [Caenorhabditis sp. 36 PRJEB53466]|nr:unnamed protein product [Caenorhabditis sp. 36 PRJEB53466]